MRPDANANADADADADADANRSKTICRPPLKGGRHNNSELIGKHSDKQSYEYLLFAKVCEVCKPVKYEARELPTTLKVYEISFPFIYNMIFTKKMILHDRHKNLVIGRKNREFVGWFRLCPHFFVAYWMIIFLVPFVLIPKLNE